MEFPSWIFLARAAVPAGDEQARQGAAADKYILQLLDRDELQIKQSLKAAAACLFDQFGI